MPNIFTYNDYRKLLADYYQEKKTETPSFSYQNFSKKAGFASKSFVFNVIQGKKNLSSSSIVQICEAMGLNRLESSFFEKLVYFNQASNFKERSFFFEQLNAIQPRDNEAICAKKIRQDQFDYYSKWYNVTIRSLIDLFPFKNDYKWLARMVYPSITPQQAKKSVQLLERLGLIEKSKDGHYKITSK
ncbi:MAG: TIGR02147 family protein, partial [Fibrobacterota bacterium]